MTVHLFLGGPIHLESRDLPWGTPRHWDVPLLPKMPIVGYTAKDELIPLEELVLDRFTYVPERIRRGNSKWVPLMEATVYVPAHMSKDDRWELVKFCGLGQIAEG